MLSHRGVASLEVGARMAGDALPLVEALHGTLAVPGLQALPDQLIGHRVVVTVDLDVVVDVHPHLLPLGEFVGLFW